MILHGTLLALALAGLALSVHAAFRLQPRAAEGSIFRTPYARVFGLPNSVISLVYFAAVAAFAGHRLAFGPVLPVWPMVAAAGLSVVFSAYLAYRLFVTLRAG